ncbi:hypothetical protein DOC35_19305 [Salmonella enterica subsp. enterica]|nr:hypothetical protein [Salmonella enterica subsp. enterica]
MRTLSHFEAGRALAELMLYVNDSGQPVKIVRPGGGGACALISMTRLESLTQQLKKLTGELDNLDAETRRRIYKELARKD